MATKRIGVTGFSRAGKTVFLTSLLHHLLDCSLEDWSKSSRFKGITLSGRADNRRMDGQVFPYDEFVDYYRAERPSWPPPTIESSSYRVKLHILTENKRRSTVLEFFDYPGEMLVDVPLCWTSYDEWCDEVWPRLERGKSAAPDEYEHWQRAVNVLASNDCTSEASIDGAMAEANDRYLTFCRAAKANRRLVFAPTKPLLLSQLSEIPQFSPLPECLRENNPAVLARMRRACEEYERSVVQPFFRQLSYCDTHVVLVDLFDILVEGTERYNQVRKDLRSTLETYEYVNRNGHFARLSRWLRAKLRRPCVREVLFCATKADHADRNSRANLKLLLKELVKSSSDHLIAKSGLDPEYFYCASVKATVDREATFGDQTRSALFGRPKNAANEKEDHYPANGVPASWRDLGRNGWPAFYFREFAPCRFPDIDGVGAAHIQLDAILWKLLEEYL